MNLIPQNALLEFAGCVLVVSHDRYFLDRVSFIAMNAEVFAWRAGRSCYVWKLFIRLPRISLPVKATASGFSFQETTLNTKKIELRDSVNKALNPFDMHPSSMFNDRLSGCKG
jgi:hypothetical protein